MKPFMPSSTTKSDTPCAPLDGSVLAHTMTTSHSQPLVMNTFEPLMIQSSPSCLATVLMLAKSEPAAGSVMPSAPIHSPETSLGRIRLFCSSVP